MEIYKKWWFWYLIAFLILMVIYKISSGDPSSSLIGFFLTILIPAFVIISLILNIIKNKKNKVKIVSDWRFWIWVIILLIILFWGWLLGHM
jgi:hypothetical protein